MPLHQASPSSAGATAVVLPAPGGAISTALARSRSAASSAGKTAAIGKFWARSSGPALTPPGLGAVPGKFKGNLGFRSDTGL